MSCITWLLAVNSARDIDGDLTVELSDLVLLTKAYGSKPGDPHWNPIADINSDNVIGLTDLVILAQHYELHYHTSLSLCLSSVSSIAGALCAVL